MYAAALLNPCQGPLNSIYPGEKGSVARFVIDQSFSALPGDGAFTAGFYPALNGSFFQSHNNGGVVQTPNWSVGASSSAGFATLTAVANKARVVACCVEVSIPAISQLNMVGEITTFLGAATSFQSTGITNQLSPNDVFTVSPIRYLVRRKVYEQKWAPGTMDSRYSGPFDYASTDPSDCNAIFIAGRGLPGATAISIKWTIVVEYTAKRLSGLSTSASNIRPGSHDTPTNVAAHLHSKHPGWASSAKDAFSGFINAFGAGLGSGAVDRAFKGAGPSRASTLGGSWESAIVTEIEEMAPLMLEL